MVKETTESWADESPVPEQEKTTSETVKKSVADFDYDEARSWGSKQVKDLSITQMLQVLITRGKDQTNPALASGAERLLRQLHREYLGGSKPYRGRQRGRGRSQRNGPKKSGST